VRMVRADMMAICRITRGNFYSFLHKNIHFRSRQASKRKKEDGSFPPQYNSIRASRANAAPILPLGGIAGLGRDVAKNGIGAAIGGFDIVDNTRQFSVQNYHLVGQRRNVPSTESMPPIGGPDPTGCLSCSDSLLLTESLGTVGKGAPVVIILSDQAFPPVLPR
jgi:hypothetical protein